MAEMNTTAPSEPIERDYISEAAMAMDRAFGIIDSLYTLEITGDFESLCAGSFTSMLDAAMCSIGEAQEAISLSWKTRAKAEA